MKKILFFFLIVSSCTIKEGHRSTLTTRLDGDSIIIENSKPEINHSFSIMIDSISLGVGSVTKHTTIDIPKLLKTNTKKKELAHIAAKNNGIYNIQLQIDHQLNNVFEYHHKTKVRPNHDTISFTGLGAKLVYASGKINYDEELKRWLFRRRERFDDSFMSLFNAYYYDLMVSDYKKYIPQGKIPVVHKVDGLKYKINSKIEADYYAVVACYQQEYIDKCVEDFVINDFKGLSTSLTNPIICNCSKNISGYKIVFLLCINKDWTYKQIPLSVFAIDNAPPDLNDYAKEFFKNNTQQINTLELQYKDSVIVYTPTNNPSIFGGATVSVVNFQGNGLECNVTFKVTFYGDTKSVTIQRRDKKLCYYHLKPEDKIIYASQHESPYVFNYTLHLESGDNFIPIMAEDYNGNIVKSQITVSAKFVRDSEVNIENRIENNIYN